jgi:hypothetical protein
MDYSQQMADLANAALICERHAIIKPVNGIQPEYPRWPNAWVHAGCEKVWRWFLESQTITPDDKDDYQAVAREARRLR